MDPDCDWDRAADRLGRKGFAYAIRLLGNADDAADAVQESLGILWSRRRTLRHDRNPAAWFFKVLRNRCIDALRKRHRRRHASIEPDGGVDPRDDRPDRIAERDEFRDRLARELENLESSLREILLLREEQNLTYAQIAEVLAIPQGTVMSRLYRARMNLRDRLKDVL